MSHLQSHSSICVCRGSAGLHVFAQNVTGTIVGTVTDPLRGARCRGIRHRDEYDTNISQKVTTDNSGNYTASLLPVGHYAVAAESKSSKREVKSGIMLNVNDKLAIDLAMQVGNTSEIVNVEAAPVQVNLQ